MPLHVLPCHAVIFLKHHVLFPLIIVTSLFPTPLFQFECTIPVSRVLVGALILSLHAPSLPLELKLSLPQLTPMKLQLKPWQLQLQPTQLSLIQLSHALRAQPRVKVALLLVTRAQPIGSTLTLLSHAQAILVLPEAPVPEQLFVHALILIPLP